MPDCKHCRVCKTLRSLSHFHRDQHSPDGHARDCRECRRKAYQTRRLTNGLRDSRNYFARLADSYRTRWETLIASLPDAVLDRLPDDAFVPAKARRLHRANYRKRTLRATEGHL
jgi:hypothetical protein